MRSELDACLVGSRPRAVAALCRYFGDLERAEDAFQEACVRALRSWPAKGRPRDPTGWLVMVGRNAGIDQIRRDQRWQVADDPNAEGYSEVAFGSEEQTIRELEDSRMGDDVLRLLFTCCHPELPKNQQIALALRVVAGLTVPELARAFLVNPKTMEQRITRAKKKVGASGLPFASPSPAERRERFRAVAAMIYLIFNEGYSASGGEAHLRVPLCNEAIRLARLLSRTWPSEVEITGLLALLLLQHSRHRARLDAEGRIVLLDEQDRGLWDRSAIEEGLVLVEKALRHRRPGPYQVQAAIAAVHARAPRAEATDWAEIDRLYAVLERLRPNPVVTLNRVVAVSKASGAREALELLESLGDALEGYFHFHGVRGSLLAELGDSAALDELQRARELARTPAEMQHLDQRIEEISKKSSVDVGSGSPSPS